METHEGEYACMRTADVEVVILKKAPISMKAAMQIAIDLIKREL